jgi:hypothetical protein
MKQFIWYANDLMYYVFIKDGIPVAELACPVVWILHDRIRTRETFQDFIAHFIYDLLTGEEEEEDI